MKRKIEQPKVPRRFPPASSPYLINLDGVVGGCDEATPYLPDGRYILSRLIECLQLYLNNFFHFKYDIFHEAIGGDLVRVHR